MQNETESAINDVKGGHDHPASALHALPFDGSVLRVPAAKR